MSASMAIRTYTREEIAQNRRRVAEHVEAHPERHDQSTYISAAAGVAPIGLVTAGELAKPGCGTQACIAGWSVLLNSPEDTEMQSRPSGSRKHYTPVAGRMPWIAQAQLGLTPSSASRLFYDTNDAQARKAIRWLADHPNATAPNIRRMLDRAIGREYDD